MNKIKIFSMKKEELISAAILILLASPLLAQAQLPTTCDEFLALIGRLGRVFGQFVLAVSIIMIIVAAWKYITAAGDFSKVSEAQNTILYGVLGIFVALM